MKKLLSLTILALSALGVTASATTLEITGNLFPAGSAPDGGYGGAFAGTLNGSVPVTVYCVDIADGFDYNALYTIHVNTLSPASAGFATETRAGGYTGAFEYFGYTVPQRYEMAGYLTTQYASNIGNQPALDAIQEAIWSLLDMKTDLSSYGCTMGGSACNNDVLNAANALPSFLSAHTVNIYTDGRSDCVASGNNGGVPAGQFCMQEFVSVDPAPEPGSAVLMSLGGALLGVGALRKRKRAGR